MATATMVPIATQTLGSAAASITFSSIPGTYTDLRLVLTGTGSAASSIPALRFNGDSATNYSDTPIEGNGTAASSNGSNSSNAMWLWGSSASASTSIPTFYAVDIFSYAGSTNKTALGTYAGDFNGSGTVDVAVGLWRSTAAITSITLLALTGTFSTGTIATLWGI